MTDRTGRRPAATAGNGGSHDPVGSNLQATADSAGEVLSAVAGIGAVPAAAGVGNTGRGTVVAVDTTGLAGNVAAAAGGAAASGAAAGGDVSDTAKIGERLKAVRRARRLTLEEVAEASGITKGFLSKIERDLASASVAALLRICATLDVPLASLFAGDSAGEVVRRGSYPPIDFGGQNLSEFLLTPTAERRVQVIYSEILSGGGSGNEGYSLPAEVEFVFVVSGQLELGFAERSIQLGTGDAYTFDPGLSHTFRAADPGRPTTVLWVICPGLTTGNDAEFTRSTRTPTGYATDFRV